MSSPRVFNPGLPGKLKLENTNWKACGKRYCATPVEMKKELRNKGKIGRWMTSAKSTIQYYQSVTNGQGGSPAAQ